MGHVHATDYTYAHACIDASVNGIHSGGGGARASEPAIQINIMPIKQCRTTLA